MPEDIAIQLWSRIVRAFFALHREVYFSLGSQIRGTRTDIMAWLPALGFAFALGLLHALTPGHGKAVVFSYFVGQSANPWAGLRMALKIAVLHVGSAVVLFFVLHVALAAVMDRPMQGVPALQPLSYGLIALYGAWLVFRSAGRSKTPAESHRHGTGTNARVGVLAWAVGLLPCPLTLFVLGFAMANATLAGGLLLIAIMTLGIAATIGAVSLAGIVARRAIMRGFDPGGRNFGVAMRVLETGSAVAILVLGTVLLVGWFSLPARPPFG